VFGSGDVVVGGVVGEGCVVDPALCFGLVELEPYAAECGDGGLEGGSDAMVAHEECDVVHVRRNEYRDIVPGQCGGYLVQGLVQR